MARPIVQAITLEKFHSTDRFAELFHLELFAIYDMTGFAKPLQIVHLVFQEVTIWNTETTMVHLF